MRWPLSSGTSEPGLDRNQPAFPGIGVPDQRLDTGSVPGAVVKLASEVAGPSRKPRIDGAVKAWLDSVLVPAMVRQYLDSRENGGLSCTTERVQ
jgi:hypothetical protein